MVASLRKLLGRKTFRGFWPGLARALAACLPEAARLGCEAKSRRVRVKGRKEELLLYVVTVK
jgi:hypothetical protein